MKLVFSYNHCFTINLINMNSSSRLPFYSSLILLFCFIFSNSAFGQGKLRYNFDESKTTYVSFFFRTQTWIRYTELNPGSLINSEAQSSYTDFSLRRVRFGLASQYNEHVYFYAMLGSNNLNMNTKSSFQLKMLDFLAEYRFSKAFEIGFGKTGWQGLSRWNIRSSKSMLGLDVSSFAINTADKVDDAGRQFGIYTKGQIQKFDYRLVLNQTMSPTNSAPKVNPDFAYIAPRFKTGAYVKYQFFDEESNKSAYSSGTYVGKKKVLALGAGFSHQAKATWSNPNFGNPFAPQDTLFHSMFHWGVDLFMDLPMSKESGTALTAFIGYYDFNFGPNYLRYSGSNNISNGVNASKASLNGAGNAFPLFGTGNSIFTQLGYLLPKELLGKDNGQLQPSISVLYSNFDALDQAMILYDFGVNWFFNGHDNKLTLGYQARPIYKTDASNKKTISNYNGMWVLQYTIEIN